MTLSRRTQMIHFLSKPTALGFLAILLLLPGAARSEQKEKPTLEATQRAVVESWERRLDAAEAHLRTGDYAKARDAAHGIELHMLANIGGPGAGKMLARTLVARSLAQAGLGQMQDALWDWFAARALDPELTDASLARSGREGQALVAAIASLPERSELKATGAANLSRARKVSGEAPDYPAALWRICPGGDVLVEGFLDEQGRLHRPVVTSSPDPLLSLASLEALRSWRFEPAEIDGKPVKVFHTVTASFKPSRCRSAQKRASDKADAGYHTIEPIAANPGS
jgi:Gram-negative bacterial TonB protein C-terminal